MMSSQFDDKPMMDAQSRSPEIVEIDDDDDVEMETTTFQNGDGHVEQVNTTVKREPNPIETQPRIDEYQLHDETIAKEKINLEPIDMDLLLSSGNPNENLIINHSPTLSAMQNNTQSTDQAINSMNPQTRTSSNDLIQNSQTTSAATANQTTSHNEQPKSDQATGRKGEIRLINKVRVPDPNNPTNFRIVTLKWLPPIDTSSTKATTSVDEPVTKQQGTTRPTIQTLQTSLKIIIKASKVPTNSNNESSNDSASTKNIKLNNVSKASKDEEQNDKIRQCIKSGCTKPSIKSADWDNEFCSSECLIGHCKDVFKSWVQSRTKQN